MLRRGFLVWCAGVASRLFAQSRPDALPVLIDVGPHKTVTITVLQMNKQDLSSLMASFMPTQDSRSKLRNTLAEAEPLTIILTSSSNRVTPDPAAVRPA